MNGSDKEDKSRPSSGQSGKPLSVRELVPQVYAELRALARAYMRRERGDHTLEATALVHEAYLRLAGAGGIDWQGRTHFLAVAATQMRRVLIEHARAAGRKKRGGGRQAITLHDGIAATTVRIADLLSLDETLQGLALRSERQARVAEMRLFAGMRVKEIAQILDVSERTVKQDWKVARAWLAGALRSGGGATP